MKDKYFSAKAFKMNDRENMFGVPSSEDYEEIKKYLNGEVDQSDIFVYPILLCDNEEDRDGEKFDHAALVEIANKYCGVTGIHDHEHTSSNQHSVTYKTELVTDEAKTNSLGEPYEYVVGYQYMLNNDKNKGLIDDIKAGIKKGASIGFEYKSCKCSICGTNWKTGKCEHKKGKTYKGKKCVGIMTDITDAYEWSFVAVPSQRNAGVIKEYNNEKEEDTVDIKQLVTKACASLSEEESSIVLKAFEGKSDGNKDKEIEGLKATLKSYKDKIDLLEKSITTAKLKSAKEIVFKGLVPVNDTAKQMAEDKVDEMLSIDEEGEVKGIDEARQELDTNYNFLFNVQDADDEFGDGNETTEFGEENEGETDEKPELEGEKSANKPVKKSGAQFSMGVKAAPKANGVKRYQPGVRELL
jgi:hypothetical protein